MISALAGKAQEINIVSDERAAFCPHKVKLSQIALCPKTRFYCRRNVNAVAPKAMPDIRVNILIQMETNAVSPALGF